MTDEEYKFMCTRLLGNFEYLNSSIFILKLDEKKHSRDSIIDTIVTKNSLELLLDCVTLEINENEKDRIDHNLGVNTRFSPLKSSVGEYELNQSYQNICKNDGGLYGLMTEFYLSRESVVHFMCKTPTVMSRNHIDRVFYFEVPIESDGSNLEQALSFEERINNITSENSEVIEAFRKSIEKELIAYSEIFKKKYNSHIEYSGISNVDFKINIEKYNSTAMHLKDHIEINIIISCHLIYRSTLFDGIKGPSPKEYFFQHINESFVDGEFLTPQSIYDFGCYFKDCYFHKPKKNSFAGLKICNALAVTKTESILLEKVRDLSSLTENQSISVDTLFDMLGAVVPAFNEVDRKWLRNLSFPLSHAIHKKNEVLIKGSNRMTMISANSLILNLSEIEKNLQMHLKNIQALKKAISEMLVNVPIQNKTKKEKDYILNYFMTVIKKQITLDPVKYSGAEYGKVVNEIARQYMN